MNQTMVKWIVNYQKVMVLQGQSLLAQSVSQKQDIANALTLALKDVDNDGHSGGSYYWTKMQSQKIHDIGWKRWTDSHDAQTGYGGVGIDITKIGTLNDGVRNAVLRNAV